MNKNDNPQENKGYKLHRPKPIFTGMKKDFGNGCFSSFRYVFSNARKYLRPESEKRPRETTKDDSVSKIASVKLNQYFVPVNIRAPRFNFEGQGIGNEIYKLEIDSPVEIIEHEGGAIKPYYFTSKKPFSDYTKAMNDYRFPERKETPFGERKQKRERSI